MAVVTELRILSPLDLTFPRGLPGLGEAHEFHLEPLGDGSEPNPFGRLVASGPVRLATGATASPLRLIVAAPALLWPEYAVTIDDATEALLEIERPDEAAALVVVTLGTSVEASTANLFAPIVLNTTRRLAAQIVPDELTEADLAAMYTPLPISTGGH